MTHRAVVLARGLGSRMRAPDPRADLAPGQAYAADAGLKAMFPIHGRPLLDYVLSELADAGLTDVALVVAPDDAVIRRYYGADAPPTRVHLSYVVQPEPRGTADAVLAVERWTDHQPFIVLNADNIYPSAALAALAALDEPGLPVFEAEDLVRTSNIPPERLRAFALIEIDQSGYLTHIVEKPDPRTSNLGPRTSHLGPRLISMNCWRFDARIFDACRDVPLSPRGEYELPGAVAVALARGIRLRAVPAKGPVLDLSRRGDARDLADRLSGVEPKP
jgi:glucose-1-phosphate thymidylyltransferase